MNETDETQIDELDEVLDEPTELNGFKVIPTPDEESVVGISKKQEFQEIPHSLLRSFVETYYDYQLQRIMTNNRFQMNAERNGIDEKTLIACGIREVLSPVPLVEKNIKKRISNELPRYKIFNEYLSQIMGVGPIIAAGLIAYTDNPERFEKPSHLIQYAGFGMNTYCKKCEEYTHIVIDYENREGKKTKAKRLKAMKTCPKCNGPTVSERERRITGYQSNWNDKFKVLCWKIGQSFIKQKATKSRYRAFYDQFKKELREKYPEKIVRDGKTLYNDGHIHNMATRKTVKLFLTHFLTKWREIEGLEISAPYVSNLPGHNVIQPFTDKIVATESV